MEDEYLQEDQDESPDRRGQGQIAEQTLAPYGGREGESEDRGKNQNPQEG